MTWTCLRVQSRQERRVLALLTEANVMAYAPMEVRKVVVKHPHRPEIRRTVARTSALIPAYVFAFLPDDRAIDAAKSVRLVREIMSDPFGKPRQVNTQQLGELILMDAFKLFDETYEAPKPKSHTPKWEKGAKVKGKKGLAAGWFGKVTANRRDQSIEVMFVVFGKETRLVVKEDAVIADEYDSVRAGKGKRELEAA